MTDSEKRTMERTRSTLFRHLDDLNDQVDADGGRIRDPMVLDGIKDCVSSICRMEGMRRPI